MKNIMSWFIDQTDTVKKLRTEVAELCESINRVSELQKEVNELKQQLHKVLFTISQFEARRPRNNNGPWFDLVSAEYDAKHGIQLEIDWNSKFVDMLRKHGFTGKDEESVVNAWLSQTNSQIIASLEEKSATNLVNSYEQTSPITYNN